MSMEHYTQIHQKFIQQEKQIRQGPLQGRGCRDICCLVLFFILVLGFMGIGIYYLVVANAALNPGILKAKYFTQPLTVIKQLVQRYWPIIVGVFGLALLLALVFVCLLRYCTKCMVYTLLIVAILIMAGIIAISAISKAWGTVIATSIGLLLFICVILCFRKEISRGIALLKATMQFLRKRPSVYLVPFYIQVLGICFLAFWIVTLICMQHQASNNLAKGLPNTKQMAFYIFWLLMIVFMAIFLYYVMVFLIAYVCATWYYGNKGQGCCRAIGLLNRAHIGSLTFATLFITIVKLIQQLGSFAYQQSAQNGNCFIACCMCCFSCCLAQIEYLVEVMNKYSAIAMSLAGQGYISSARIALAVLFRDFPLFFVCNGMGDLIKISGVIFAAGIPTLVAYLLIEILYPESLSSHSYQATMLILLIFLICMVICYYFIFLITIAQSCVFFFFCLDRRYRDIGVTISETPNILKSLEKNPQFHNGQANDYVPGSAERIF